MNNKLNNDMLLKEKMEIVNILFTPSITDENNCLLDDAYILHSNHKLVGARVFARKYLNENYKLTKNDLIYINETINKLVKLLSLNKKVITKKYITNKLFIWRINSQIPKKFEVTDEWINAYKQLITYIKNNK